MRSYLKEGTWVRFPDGECYEIIGSPIGEGGTGLVYPAIKQRKMEDGHYQTSGLDYIIKECYPAPSTIFDPMFIRTDSGEILPQHPSPKSLSRLHTAQCMQQAEEQITASIYHTGFRLTPTLNSSRSVQLSFDHGATFVSVQNTVTVMESLEKKGQALKSYFIEETGLPAIQAFHVTEQILFAVREIHQAGYLHLDIQECNIFIKGSLTDNSDLVSLIDFGSSQKYLDNGSPNPINRESLFTTYVAPEILSTNEDILYLGPETDIYSIGCILFLLLTGQEFVPETQRQRKRPYYLTKLKLRHISCPKHLVEKMQQILAKALAENPETRYHSCDEMLAEVSDFAKALQPYRSDLSQVTYDAFICYRHGPIDSKAAQALQKNLEHFRTPRDLCKAGKRIRRIFVDKGELSSCSDFQLQTREALKNAGFLIVICSPGTKDSYWVNYEIDTFLEFHDPSRVLAIMTSGEPKEIFPRKLLGTSAKSDEVLAADARGQDLHTVLKRLKKDALLQIAAPILGTTYDSLKQRHRIYRIQRIMAASFTTLFGLAAFTFYQSWQSALINQQYQQARRNQARYTASISQSLLAEGDREKALLTALAIQPDKDNDGPVVPEQMYALNNALTSYKDGLSVRFDPAYVGENDGASYAVLSPDGQYYYVVDENGNAVVLSGKTGKLQWSITPAQIKGAISDLYPYHKEKFDHINLILPISEKEFAVVLDYCIARIDLNSQDILHVFPLDAAVILTQDGYDQKDNLFAYSTYSGELYVYDLNTGQKVNYLSLNKTPCDKELHYDYAIESVSFNEKKDAIALGLSHTLKNQMGLTILEPLDTDAELPELPSAGIILYELDTQTTIIPSSIPACRVRFADESHIAAIHFTSPASGTMQKDALGVTTFSYYQTLYDISANCILFQGEPTTLSLSWNMGIMSEPLMIEQKDCSALISWIRGSLIIVDIHSGAVLKVWSYRPDIIGVSTPNKKSLFISLADGSVQRLSLNPVLFSQQILSLDANISQYTFNQTEETIILRSGHKLLFCNQQGDPEMKQLQIYSSPNSTGDTSNTIQNQNKQIYTNYSGYIEMAGQVYRYLCFRSNVHSGITEIRIYPVHSDELIYHYECPDAEYRLNNIGFGFSQDAAYLSFVETSIDNQSTFVKVNLTTGTTLIYEDISSYNTLCFTDLEGIVYSGDMNTMYVKRFKGVVPFDISGDTLVPSQNALLPRRKINEMALTGDKKHLILTATDPTSNELVLYDYHCETRTLTQLDSGQDILTYGFTKILFPGQTSSLIGVYGGGETITVIDCSDHSVVTAIETDDRSQMAFFDHDHFLIFAGQSTINLYDLQEKKNTYTYTCPEVEFERIITDSNNSHYFGLKNASYSGNYTYDPKSNRQPLFIFYVDDNHAFFPYAHVDFGYASFAGNEVCTLHNDVFTYSHLYDYAYLKKKALDILDGKALTIEEQQEYFLESYQENP